MLRTSPKSRRDDTLLTVDFNLRKRNVTDFTQVPQGRHLYNEELRMKNVALSSFSTLRSSLKSIVPAGLCNMRMLLLFRRLKSTVNRVSSLRDFAADKQI